MFECGTANCFILASDLFYTRYWISLPALVLQKCMLLIVLMYIPFLVGIQRQPFSDADHCRNELQMQSCCTDIT